MNINLHESATVAWIVSLASIIFCPALCAVMASRLSSAYAPQAPKPEPRKLKIVPTPRSLPIDEASVNAAAKNLVC